MDTETIDSAVLNEEQLSLDLIEAQYALMNTRDQSNAKSLVILVSGIELAGKGEAVKQLREWVDPRFLYVKADPPHLFNLKQPFWQPYTRFVPAEGQIMVWFGNWYGDLLATAMHASKPLDDTLFDEYVSNMRAFEQDLKNNNVDVLKVGEEAVETIIAAKDFKSEANEDHKNDLIYEVADLWFHTIVVLGYFDLDPQVVLNELARRQGLSGLLEKANRSH